MPMFKRNLQCTDVLSLAYSSGACTLVIRKWLVGWLSRHNRAALSF